ncbi:MAG: ABC transporter ATP-binding protein [Minwuia sp.]|uniref:ABC transporter ATP-binding protein n=1 Tax=Minwuia sp. TaxID=2493630 RepID=UPI003A842E5A
MIRVRVTAKRHADADVLGSVAFDIGDAETVAVCGRSGVGKTTLLHLIAGLDRDFDGEIEGFGGRVGYVFQSPRLLPWRTALQNLRIVAPERAEADLLALLDDVGVGEAAHLYPAQLSLGMARRVAIARALAVQPDLLLLDEPFASLDAETASRLRRLLQDLLARAPVPALLVTHDPAEALELAQRVVVLGGRPATVRLDQPAGDLDAAALAASIAQEQA